MNTPRILKCSDLPLCSRGSYKISKISNKQVLIDYASAEAGRFYLFSQVDCESLALTACLGTAKWIKLFKKLTIQKRDAVPHLRGWEHISKNEIQQKPGLPISSTVRGNDASNYKFLKEDNRERNRARQGGKCRNLMNNINKSVAMHKNLAFPDFNYSIKLALKLVCIKSMKNNAFNFKYVSWFPMHLIYHLILHILLKFHILIILLCIGNLTEASQKFNIIPRAKQLINWWLNVTPKPVLYTIVLKPENVPFKIYHFSMKKKN